MRRALLAAVAVALCASTDARGGEARGGIAWSEWTASPMAIDAATLEPLEREAIARCGAGEEGLREAARAIVARKTRGAPMGDEDAIARDLRAAGEPHPWARAWAATGRALDPDATMRALDAWLGRARDSHGRRCGAASGTAGDGTRVVAVVVVDAMADLAPLPRRARAGQWLDVSARMRVQARGGKVIVLGPSGAPRTVPAWMEGTTLRARFAPDRAGEHAVQVVADLDHGPRPVAEATVFADIDPPARIEDRAAPGESVDTSGSDDERVERMLSAARASEGLPSLARDSRLDAVAHAYAIRIAHARTLAHDLGDGDPADRLRAASLDARDVGENLAHARTLARAHRALWSSPSHRMNLLSRDFDRAGIAAVRDEDGDGDVWVVELFAGDLR